MREPREGDPVTIRGDERRDVWVIAYVGVALGHHHQEAHLRLARESWAKPTRTVKLSDCEPLPADLEDFR